MDAEAALLAELDAWAQARGLRLVALLLGGSALRMHGFVDRPTKDLDLVAELLSKVEGELERTFGKRSGRRPFLDLVSAGLPPLPDGWKSRAVPVEGDWVALDVSLLAPFDLVVSKLRAWRPHDRRDIEAICRNHPELIDSLTRLDRTSFWDWDRWEETMAPRRDMVVAFLEGRRGSLEA